MTEEQRELLGALAFDNGSKLVKLSIENQTQEIWATTNEIADIFDVDRRTIVEHITNIYKSEELHRAPTCRNFQQVQFEGDRKVTREVSHYNLDMILSIGYRTNAKKAIQFRQWSSQIIKTYLEKGFVINEKALKEEPDKLKDLAAKIRELRSSESNIYAKVRECFKISAIDYKKDSKKVSKFYSLLQDKFHFAITGLTSAKLILDRADHTLDNMGVFSMEGTSPTKKEVAVGKNYLREKELYSLYLLSEQFLLIAESASLRGLEMTMDSLTEMLDGVINLNKYEVFQGYSESLRNTALLHAEKELTLYRKRIKLERMGINYDEDLLESGEYEELLASSY